MTTDGNGDGRLLISLRQRRSADGRPGSGCLRRILRRNTERGHECRIGFQVERERRARDLARVHLPGWSCRGGRIRSGARRHAFGTTQYGGACGDGSVFKVATSGVTTILHSFNGVDGENPQYGVTLCNDGNLYGSHRVRWCGRSRNAVLNHSRWHVHTALLLIVQRWSVSAGYARAGRGQQSLRRNRVWRLAWRWNDLHDDARRDVHRAVHLQRSRQLDPATV